MYATDRQTSYVRRQTTASLNASALTGQGHNKHTSYLSLFALPKFGSFDGLPRSQFRQHNTNDVHDEDEVHLPIMLRQSC